MELLETAGDFEEYVGLVFKKNTFYAKVFLTMIYSYVFMFSSANTFFLFNWFPKFPNLITNDCTVNVTVLPMQRYASLYNT